MWVLDSVCGILFVVVCGVAVGGWWYCGFVFSVGVGGCVVLILMLVVFWCCKHYVSLIFQIWLKSLFLLVQLAKPD